jgi:hypothetical protein
LEPNLTWGISQTQFREALGRLADQVGIVRAT